MAKGGGEEEEEEAGGTHVAISWPKAPATSLLGVAALVWPRTQSVGGMLWPHVLGEGDATGWPQWRRGCGGGFHICSCSAASHILEIWGWDCVSPHGPPMPWGQQEGRGQLLPRI